jgi:ribosomal protein S3AE
MFTNLYKCPKFPLKHKMAEQSSKPKKKKWYKIVAPKQFNGALLGETYIADPNLMLGKTLKFNLMNLTNDMKKQNINMKFKVDKVEDNKGITSVIGFQIIHSSVKRFVRRNSEKMSLSFACETSDNVYLRVKPLVIARGELKSSIAARLRNTIERELKKIIKAKTYDELMSELITRKIQMGLKSAMHKIYPLKICELRYIGIEDREKPQEVKAEA